MKARLLIPLLLIMAACTTNKPMTEEQKAAVLDEATVAVHNALDALMTSNTVKWLESLENSEEATFISFGDFYTYKQAEEMATQFFPEITRQTFITAFERYIVINPDCFLYIWQGDNSMYMKSGDSTILEDYVLSYAFRKTDGKWKIFFGHESQKVPMPIDTALVQ